MRLRGNPRREIEGVGPSRFFLGVDLNFFVLVLANNPKPHIQSRYLRYLHTHPTYYYSHDKKTAKFYDRKRMGLKYYVYAFRYHIMFCFYQDTEAVDQPPGAPKMLRRVCLSCCHPSRRLCNSPFWELLFQNFLKISSLNPTPITHPSEYTSLLPQLDWCI